MSPPELGCFEPEYVQVVLPSIRDVHVRVPSKM